MNNYHHSCVVVCCVVATVDSDTNQSYLGKYVRGKKRESHKVIKKNYRYQVGMQVGVSLQVELPQVEYI